MFKRFGFFLLVNLAMILTISVLTHLLGFNHWLEAKGINYELLFGFCLVWGMGGAFISLLISKYIAKLMMKVKVISPQTRDPNERELLDMVYRMAKSAGITKMPEVGYYDSPEVNAFATGPSRNNSLVAVSTGLMQRMNRDQVEGVIGHEVAHIANGDMVTMTLIQGVMNAFVMFIARAIAFGMSRGSDRESSPLATYGIVILLEIVLGILAMFVISYFSRLREFRADKGGARYAGREKMISALKALSNTQELVDHSHASLQTLKISGGIAKFLSTHPPLSERIRRLELGR